MGDLTLMLYYINRFYYNDADDGFLTENNLIFKIPVSKKWYIMNRINLSLSGKLNQFG